MKVTSGGVQGAMESFRYIVHEGRDTTMTSIMHRRMKVMNPEMAKNAEDVEKKIQMWKNDIRLLLESRQEQDIKMMEINDQMITILISMLPDRVAEYLMTKYEVGVTALNEMEVALQEHMMKIVENSLRSKSGRKIGQVANQLGEGGDEEEDWQQHWDAQGGEYWIRTAMKRPRTEEHEFERNRMQEEDAREVRKGNVEGGKASVKGKGPKGKGKGPKGGCHECGGDHYVRDCPVRQERKGTGKGWWTIDSKSVQPRYWSSWNIGFIPKQWSSWRSGTKGGGKGKGFPGSKGDGNVSMLDFSRLSFPPLCAVSNQGGTADQGCESPWDSGHAYHGGDTEQVSWQGMYSVTKSRKRRQFTKTTGFDEDLAVHTVVDVPVALVVCRGAEADSQGPNCSSDHGHSPVAEHGGRCPCCAVLQVLTCRLWRRQLSSHSCSSLNSGLVVACPLCATTGAEWFGVQKTVFVPQLQCSGMVSGDF